MSIDLSNILLTGGSGTLGTQIIKSELFDNLLTPSKKVLDITKLTSIKNCAFSKPKILKLIKKSLKTNRFHKTFHFGKGKSYQKFETILKNNKMWKLSNQKNFKEIK